MTKNYYITTPIYYVNDIPHIGHVYTSLICDVIARFKRLEGYDVYFLTGTDEHGQKVEKSAKKKNIDTQKFTDEVSQRFFNLSKFMNYSNNDFIRTTEERHKKGVCALWERLEKKGYIYLDKYKGWYSVRDEAYYQESDLTDGKAPTGAEVEWVEEESYFFKLSLFQDKLLKLYEENPKFIVPLSRYNEVVSFVKGGKEKVQGALRDLSISRTAFGWGVKVPGNEKHVIYVWLDALSNYITALGFPDEKNDLYKQFWPADIHMVGKDIIRFHAVYWPAFLIAAEIELPKCIVAHGWWTNEGQKISKSLGNVIDPVELVRRFGLDQIRYFLMREVSFGNDGNYSEASLIKCINSDLSNNIGNLLQRTLSMVHKNCEGKIPEYKELQEVDTELLEKGYCLLETVKEYFNNNCFDKAVIEIVAFASNINVYIDNCAPWKLKKENPLRMQEILYVTMEAIRCLAIIMQPYIPNAMSLILDLLAVPKENRDFSFLFSEHKLKSGVELPEIFPVFPRFEV